MKKRNQIFLFKFIKKEDKKIIKTVKLFSKITYYLHDYKKCTIDII